MYFNQIFYNGTAELDKLSHETKTMQNKIIWPNVLT